VGAIVSDSTYHRLGDVITEETDDNLSILTTFDFNVEEHFVGNRLAEEEE
jgi:hypothetical protein